MEDKRGGMRRGLHTEDEEIIRAQSGEKEAIKNILERYKFFIMKEGAKYRIPSYELEDILQYSYLGMMKCIRSYRVESGRFNAYMVNAIRNNMRYLLRGSMKWKNEIKGDVILEKGPIIIEMSIEDHIIANEAVNELRKAMEELQPDEQDFIERIFLKGENMADYARSEDMKYVNVSYKKRRILKKLKKGIIKLQDSQKMHISI